MHPSSVAPLVIVGSLLALASPAAAQGAPELAGNYIRGGRVAFTERDFTEEGRRRYEAYDFTRDDPGYGCLAASWARVWLNPNVVVQVSQAKDHVRFRHEFMDIDRRVPLVDAQAAKVTRSNIKGMPALGSSAAWYDGDTLVIETIDVAPGYFSTMQEWAGLPQSRRMRTVERIRRNGKDLGIEITHTDPAYYRKPIVTTIEYKATDYELMEYGCNPDDAKITTPN